MFAQVQDDVKLKNKNNVSVMATTLLVNKKTNILEYKNIIQRWPLD